jgi:hypothetical protein
MLLTFYPMAPSLVEIEMFQEFIRSESDPARASLSLTDVSPNVRLRQYPAYPQRRHHATR